VSQTTVLWMVTAYAMIANGGRRVTATMIDRIQDRYGRAVYKHDQRECRGCDAKKWENQPEPGLIDRREQVLDPMTTYQITEIMEGVIQRGTANVLADLRKPIAGKTHQRREGRLVRRLHARSRGRRLYGLL
jgi:penicillin-binding protein 1A